eukprot:TRINITY_DN48895_c0_g1_i1.p1 TRINITY_DN48895_c0_g1~~TRINITY_DN48895_c0_g1_i1.p1  ORF type:complete len:143 (+),score=27.97 TRINITY_DN48895_c0_g1_i1:29-457(+)
MANAYVRLLANISALANYVFDLSQPHGGSLDVARGLLAHKALTLPENLNDNQLRFFDFLLETTLQAWIIDGEKWVERQEPWISKAVWQFKTSGLPLGKSMSTVYTIVWPLLYRAFATSHPAPELGAQCSGVFGSLAPERWVM